MIKARPQHAKLLDFIQIEDFGTSGSLDEAVKGVDGIVHVASVSFVPRFSPLLSAPGEVLAFG